MLKCIDVVECNRSSFCIRCIFALATRSNRFVCRGNVRDQGNVVVDREFGSASVSR